MARVGTLRFDHVQGPQYYRLSEGDWPTRTPMVALTRYGGAVGYLIAPPEEVATAPLPEDWAEPAAPADLNRRDENEAMAADALARCARLVARHELPMKLAKAFWALDRRQLTFFYSAPTRVDFRALLRDLVREFRTQLRLEQVGDRDIARLVGGCGRCGRNLCCCSWLPHFEPVSISHAREQGLAPVPSQLAGSCGRLRCCLRFESDEHHDGEHRHPWDLACPKRPIKTAAYHLYYDEDERDLKDLED